MYMCTPITRTLSWWMKCLTWWSQALVALRTGGAAHFQHWFISPFPRWSKQLFHGFIFISQTSTETVSTTLTRTITNSCVAGTFTECSADTTTEPPVDSGPFPDAIVTLINGTIVNITEILPTRSLREGRSEEGILEEDLGMQSGRISWDEVEEQESKRKPRQDYCVS